MAKYNGCTLSELWGREGAYEPLHVTCVDDMLKKSARIVESVCVCVCVFNTHFLTPFFKCDSS